MQMKGVLAAIEAENEERVFQSTSNSLNCGTLEDQAVEEDNCEYDELRPGTVRTVKLGGHYPAVILDAKPNSEPHMFKAAVFLVPRVSLRRFLLIKCLVILILAGVGLPSDTPRHHVWSYPSWSLSVVLLERSSKVVVFRGGSYGWAPVL